MKIRARKPALKARKLGEFRVNRWVMLREAVEEGARGFLWNDLPDPLASQQDVDRMADSLTNRVLNSISERFE